MKYRRLNYSPKVIMIPKIGGENEDRRGGGEKGLGEYNVEGRPGREERGDNKSEG